MEVIRKIMEQGEEGMLESEAAKQDLGVRVAFKPLFDEPAGNIAVEDFGLGKTRRYGYPQEEIHIIIQGKAEVTWNAPPWDLEEKTVTLEAGDACFIYRGDHLTFNVIEEPYRKLCILMPAHHLSSREQLTTTTYNAWKSSRKAAF